MILVRHGETVFNVLFGKTRRDPGVRDPRLTERGREQKISRFTTERRPLRVGIVLDTSLSMNRGERLTAAVQERRCMLLPTTDEFVQRISRWATGTDVGVLNQ